MSRTAGNEVTFNGESGLNALTSAGGAIHLEDAGVELKAPDDLTCEGGESGALRLAETANTGIEDAEAADHGSGWRDEGRSGVEAIRAPAEENPCWIRGIEPGVGDFVDVGIADRLLERERNAADFAELYAIG